METRSRYLTEQMALALQACSLLATSVDNDNALLDIAHTFCESRLGNGSGFAFGTLPDTTPFERIIAIGQISYNWAISRGFSSGANVDFEINFFKLA